MQTFVAQSCEMMFLQTFQALKFWEWQFLVEGFEIDGFWKLSHMDLRNECRLLTKGLTLEF